MGAHILIVSLLAALSFTSCALSHPSRWSTESHFKEISQRDGSPSNGTVTFQINSRPIGQNFYDVNLTLGTPKQDLVLAIQPLCPINTWVASSHLNYTHESLFGWPSILDGPYVFDPNTSSTAQFNNPEYTTFGYSFPDTYGQGGVVADNISIDGVSLGRREVFLLTEGDRTPGDLCFDDVGTWLTNTSLIDEEVFSIWLNGPDSAPGDIVFGGIDTEKFQGNISLLPALTALDFLGESRNVFNLLSMTILNGSEPVELTHSHPDASFELDYGDFQNRVPPDVFEPVFEILGGTSFIPNGLSDPLALVPCSIAETSLAINFTFGYNTTQTLISVPLSDLISSPQATKAAHNSSTVLSPNGTELCLFNLLPGREDDYFVLNHSVFHLGSPALKSVYTIYDKSTRRIGVGNAKPNVTTSNAVKYNKGCFPGVQFVNSSLSSSCAPSTTTQLALPTQLFTETPTSISASATPTPTSTPTSSAVKHSTGTLSLLFAVLLPICWYGS